VRMSAVLLERDSELQALRDATEAAAGRRGSVVLISGEAGIGKSALVDAWVADPGVDARMLVGWCDDFLTHRLLGPVHDVARVTGGALADAVGRANTDAVFEAMIDELHHPLRPTVLVLEDVHWADEATLDVVRFVGRRIERLPAVLALTYRELDADHPLHSVLAALPRGVVHRIRPRPLSAGAVAALTADTGLDADEVARVTGGNPFFVTEVVHDGEHVPASVAEGVVARLRGLPQAAQQALGLLSVLPRAAPVSQVSALVGDLGVLAAAEARRLIQVDAGTVRFRHELARQAVLATLPAARRLAHHETVLGQLLAEERDHAAILHHAVEAGRADVVVRFGPAAAHRAFDAGAHRQAVEHQDHVLRYEQLLEPEALAALLVERSWTLYNLQRFEEAVEAAARSARAYADLGDTQTRCRLLLTLSRMLYMANRVDDAFGALDEAGALLARLAPDRAGSEEDRWTDRAVVVAEWRVNRLALLHLTDRYTEVLEEVDAALDAARTVERPDLVAHAENYAGCATALLGDHPAGIARLRRASRIGQDGGWFEATARAYTNLVKLLVQARRWEEADAVSEEALGFYDDHDFRAHRYHTLSQLGRAAIVRGDWRTADGLLRQVEGAAQGAGILGAIPAEARALLAVRSGADDADERLERAWEVALVTKAAQYLVPTAAVGIERAWLRGRPEDADPFVAPALAAAGDSWWAGWLRWRLRLVRDLPDLRDLADVGVVPEPEATSLTGDWRAAADRWAQLRMPYEQAVELLSSGEVAAMLEALQLFDDLGAEPAARLTRQRLREHGLQSIPRRPLPATRQHPAGLTARQAEVLDRLRKGFTNAQIAEELVLSVRTVDHHVAAVLQKLGVSTRQEAAARATSLQRGGR
jgi:DNA-binding CsgD family transcriptional regulator/tetratricopeptide (TPR) repeat protein